MTNTPNSQNLYILLVTNKQSNILQDIDTLRMLSKLISEYCHLVNEENVSNKAFEIIFAFDEVLSLGQRESVNLQQVKQYTEMDSHEEKLHKLIIQSKIKDTKDIMKKKAMEIDRNKLEKMKETGMSQMMGAMGGMKAAVANSGMGNAMMDDFYPEASFKPTQDVFAEDKKTSSTWGKKGMVLGKSKSSANSFLESLKAEGDVIETPSLATGAAAAKPMANIEPVTVFLEEKLSVQLGQDGALQSMEVQGTVMLEVNTEEGTLIKVPLEIGDNPGFQFKTHPNIDKNSFHADKVLSLKDLDRPYPIGSALGVLKWRMQTNDESKLPILVNCWPSLSGRETYVSVEYEKTADMDLQQFSLAIPLPSLREAPQVNHVDGSYRFDQRQRVLLWEVDIIDDSNRNGSIELIVPSADPSSFYPIEVSFVAEKTFCDISVGGVMHATSEEPIKFGSRRALVVDSFALR
eukprot:scaffold86_cov338-Pavlova_lutheri.AAC.50